MPKRKNPIDSFSESKSEKITDELQSDISDAESESKIIDESPEMSESQEIESGSVKSENVEYESGAPKKELNIFDNTNENGESEKSQEEIDTEISDSEYEQIMNLDFSDEETDEIESVQSSLSDESEIIDDIPDSLPTIEKLSPSTPTNSPNNGDKKTIKRINDRRLEDDTYIASEKMKWDELVMFMKNKRILKATILNVSETSVSYYLPIVYAVPSLIVFIIALVLIRKNEP